MAGWLSDLGTNILAEFLFLAALLAVGWLLYVFTRRRRLLKFFGIHSSRRIPVYLSHLRIQPGGALDVVGTPRSYQGTAVAYGEVLAANRFRDVFNYVIPSLSESPGLLSKILVSDVNVQVQPSPPLRNELETSTAYITFGSPAYNIASANAEGLGSSARFDLAAGAINVQGVPPVRSVTRGFVERVADPRNNRLVFYAAGLSELGTAGAAHFLAAEWDRLHRKYGSAAPFLVMLEFVPTDFRRWTIVFER